jgi:integrase
VSVYLRGDTYWADFTLPGQKRVRQSLGTASRPEALRLERELIRQARAPAQGKRLHDALTAWLDERPRGRSDVSIVRRLAKLPDPPLLLVNEAWCREHLGALKPANYNRHVAIIRASLNLAGAIGWLASAPKIPRKRPPPGRTRFLSRAEWDALYLCLPEHLRPLASFALLTGLRLENVVRLRWDHVDLDRAIAWVDADDAKGRRTLSVPLSADAVAVLRGELGRHAEFVFTWPAPVGIKGERCRLPYAATPKTAWLAAVKKAKLVGVTFHTLRHTWASWHVMSGTPLAVLQQLGGWASIEMVQRYAHLAPDHVAAYAGRVTLAAQPAVSSERNRDAS